MQAVRRSSLKPIPREAQLIGLWSAASKVLL
jgi:hypothetical protein